MSWLSTADDNYGAEVRVRAIYTLGVRDTAATAAGRLQKNPVSV